jgi:hypothetical protein
MGYKIVIKERYDGSWHRIAVIDTSCDQSVEPGAVFGKVEVIDAQSRDGGMICSVGGDDTGKDNDKDKDHDGGSCEDDDGNVEYLYTVTNTGNTLVTGIRVDDDQLGLIGSFDLPVEGQGQGP